MSKVKKKKTWKGLLITKLVSLILINATDSNLFHGYTTQYLNKRGQDHDTFSLEWLVHVLILNTEQWL